MSNAATYVEVILPVPLAGTFTYLVEDSMLNECLPGKRVVVQFGKKKLYTGLIHSQHNNIPEDYEVKPILTILDIEPVITPQQLKLWEWGADYYMCTLGEFYKAAVPSSLRLESETRIIPVDDFDDFNHLSAIETTIYQMAQQNEALNISDVSKNIELSAIMPVIKRMIEKGAILVQEEVKQRYKPKIEKIIEANFKINDTEINRIKGELSRSSKQQALFAFFADICQKKEINQVLKTGLLTDANATPAILKGLIDKGVLQEKLVETSRLDQELQAEIQPLKILNEHQQRAHEQILEQFENHDVVLLHGVTSSGKTEIYIHLMQQVIDQGKQVLYLLPEIALTSQIIQRLKLVFGNKIGVYHSKFSGNERAEIWNNLLYPSEKQYQIILGVRSSVLLPYGNLGLIIVDEEHENTYKQFDPAPRYNARDLSVVLAKYHQAKVLMGTATPAIETYFNAKSGRYGLVELNHRYANMQLPQIVVANVRKAYKKKEMRSHFTPELFQNIETALKNNEQVILFQNRRGFSPYLECSSCSWIPTCKHCDVSLTYHKKINKLICHYCGYQENGVSHCECCHQPNMETKGFGTEKIEDEISIIFPEAKIARLDLDSTRGKNAHDQIISEFQHHKIDILIGTQMVSKGLDFDNVSLVGILNADNMLRFPDFRAYERSYQLMAQVSGRAGRKNKQGQVIIQTNDPEHYIIQQVLHNNYHQMFLTQASERKQFAYPPFTRLIRLTIKHRDRIVALNAAQKLTLDLKKIPGMKVLGPSAPVINRIQNLFLQQIVVKLIKGNNLLQAKKLISESCEQLLKEKDFKQVTLIKDVDPA